MPMKVRYTVVDGEIISEDRDGVERDYVPDALGSTVALMDANQQITDTWKYWPYGEVRTRTGVTPTEMQFVGTRGYRATLGPMSYARARVVNAKTGRWISADPIARNVNAFDYALGNPVMNADPTGLQAGCGANSASATNAVNRLCDAIFQLSRALCIAACVRVPSGTDEQFACLVAWCLNPHYDCGPCVDKVRCAQAPQGGGSGCTIRFCAPAFDPNSSCCDIRRSGEIAAHEVMHCCGRNHPYNYWIGECVARCLGPWPIVII